MDSFGKSTTRPSEKELRPRTRPEMKRLKAAEELSCVSVDQSHSSTLKGEEFQSLAIRQEHLEKARAGQLQVPHPPNANQKAPAMTRVLVRRSRPPEAGRKTVRVTVARPAPPGSSTLPLDYTGPSGPRFDAQGMILPHSILGNLEDFRKELEARGEIELVKRVPTSPAVRPPLAVLQEGGPSEKGGILDPQSQALRHWECHMAERWRQQDFLSQLLHKPVQNLLMNQSNRFREIQEQRELISRGLPALHSGQGYRVGSEFWNLPQRIGDELSGITTTLTRTERGHPEPVTRIGQPQRIREETGSKLPDDSRSVHWAWGNSLYLQHQRQELREILVDLDFMQPDIDGLEVIGRNQALTSVTKKCCPLMEENNGRQEEVANDAVKRETSAEQKENDPLVEYDDVPLDAVLIPTLRFCGQSAHWTGSSSSHQGEVGIAGRLSFEAPAGQKDTSYLELHNEGRTAIYYRWQHQAVRHSFREASGHSHGQSFYFNSSMGAILPGETQRIQFMFKSASPGIFCEVWCLVTHPVLLGGALLQVTLRGVALYQDKTAELREALERGLQQKEAATVCRLLVLELLQGVHSPERPSSPAELYLTEEERFHMINPQLHYHHGTVQELKQLWALATKWNEAKRGDSHLDSQAWDLSMPSLRQALLAMPEREREGDAQKEEALAHFHTLVLQLHKLHQRPPPLSLHSIGLQLWRELLDRLVSEAMWQRQQLGLPDRDTWGQLDQAGVKVKKEENSEKKGGPVTKEENKGGNAKENEEKRGAMKHPGKDRPAEEHLANKRKGWDEKRLGKPGKESLSIGNGRDKEPLRSQRERAEQELEERYRQRLYQQVYSLLENLVDSLCELLDEVQSSSEECVQ